MDISEPTPAHPSFGYGTDVVACPESRITLTPLSNVHFPYNASTSNRYIPSPNTKMPQPHNAPFPYNAQTSDSHSPAPSTTLSDIPISYTPPTNDAYNPEAQQLSATNAYTKKPQDTFPTTKETIFKIINHAHDIHNMLPLISSLYASQISDTTTTDVHLFDMVCVDEKNYRRFLFSSGERLLKIPENALKKECIKTLEESAKASCHWSLPILWNEGSMLVRYQANKFDANTIERTLRVLNMKVGEARRIHNFTIKQITEYRVDFLFGKRVLTIEKPIHAGKNKYKVELIDSRGESIKSAFDLNYSQFIMLFVIKNIFLLEFKYGTWRLQQECLTDKKVDMIISDALDLSSIRMISNICNYSTDDIKNLHVECFDMLSMESYQTGYFTMREALSKLVDLVMSKLPTIEGAFVGMYKYAYRVHDTFLTSHEISLYKTLGKALYICMCNGITLCKHPTTALASGLLIFHIDEIIDPNSALSISHRRVLCQRLFEVHKYGKFKYKGVVEILCNQVDAFNNLAFIDLLKIVDEFFKHSYWWQSMGLQEKINDSAHFRHILVSQCWHFMRESIMEMVYREYDAFIDPMYTITRSLASLALINENTIESFNVVKYKNSLRRLDGRLSCSPFPITDFYEERVKLRSIFAEKIPLPFSVTEGCFDEATSQKTRWINEAMGKDMQLSYDLWKFTSPVVPCDLKPVTLHTTFQDIGRMLYIAPCENRIYISPEFYIFDHDLKKWRSSTLNDTNRAKAELDFLQSVRDSILWSSGYPTKNKMMGNPCDNMFCQMK